MVFQCFVNEWKKRTANKTLKGQIKKNLTDKSGRQRFLPEHSQQRRAEGDQVSDGLEPDGQPPVGGHWREVGLLVFVQYLLRLMDELGLKIGMGPLKTKGLFKWSLKSQLSSIVFDLRSAWLHQSQEGSTLIGTSANKAKINCTKQTIVIVSNSICSCS